MFIFSVTGISLTSSFRVPETHTYHQTLPLPPRVTIIGMMGAAMGLSLEDAHKFATINKIHVNVYGKHEGTFSDLWNYCKITNKSHSEEDVKNRRHYSVLIREYNYMCNFIFYFGAENKDIINKVRESFASPVYALSTGNSDDIFKVCKISEIMSLSSEKLNKFENTVLLGNWSSKCKSNIDLEAPLPIVTTAYSPEVFNLPNTFEFIDGKRESKDRIPHTFVKTTVILDNSIDGYLIEGKNVTLQ